MIRQAGPLDLERLNQIANDPAVRPFVSLPGQEYLNMAPFLVDDRYIVLMTEHGFFVGDRNDAHLCEVHTLFLPGGRGRHVYEAAQLAFAWVFTRTFCMEIVTKIPVSNSPARRLAKRVGFVLEFTREKAWETEIGPIDCDFFALRYGDWAKKQTFSPMYGKWFHDQLGDEQTHDDDPAHDRYVGLSVMMFMAGMYEKGAVLYNRWAAFAGYAPVSVLQTDPLKVDITSHVLQFSEGGIEICQ